MMSFLDHALVAFLVVVVPPYTVWSYRRFREQVARGGAAVRRREYLATIAQQWGVTALTLGVFFLGSLNDDGAPAQRSLAALGLSEPSGWGIAVAIALLAALVSMQFWQLAHADDPEFRSAVQRKLASVRELLPVDRSDERLFAAISVTAGICEEIVYRGYVTWYAAQYVPLPAAIGLSACVFGLAHAYQGPRGVLASAMVGLVLAGLVALTGSLWIAMLVHALVDLNAGLVARLVFSREAGDESRPSVSTLAR